MKFTSCKTKTDATLCHARSVHSRPCALKGLFPARPTPIPHSHVGKVAAQMATSPKVMGNKKRLAKEQRIKKHKRLTWAERLTTLHCEEGCFFERSERLLYESQIKGSKPSKWKWKQCRKCGAYEA